MALNRLFQGRLFTISIPLLSENLDLPPIKRDNGNSTQRKHKTAENLYSSKAGLEKPSQEKPIKAMTNPPLRIKTFGCKLNHYDSLLLKKQLEGLRARGRELFVLNTCAVTAKAGRDIRREAEKIKRDHPHSLIAVTGCGAQVESRLYSQSTAVDRVVGQNEKTRLKEILEKALAQEVGQGRPSKPEEKVFRSSVFRSKGVFSGYAPPNLMGRTRAFLKIQDGCNSFCSFCIIPFARGTSKSLPSGFLLESVKKLERDGAREVVLTGVHIGDYRDGNLKLKGLVALLLKHSKIPRIRLSSLEPVELSDSLLALFENERLCPHFHISLQSASSPVLKAMKRAYTARDVRAVFQRIQRKQPRAFVGMDVIAGFPTESEKDFQETYKTLEDCSWTSAHIFPYSPREGTRAFARNKSLPQREIQKRAGILRNLAEKRFAHCLKLQKGTRKKTLLLKGDNTQGLSRDYWRIALPPSDRAGEQEVIVKQADPANKRLKATWIS